MGWEHLVNRTLVASGLYWHLELGLLKRHGPHSLWRLPLLTAWQVGVLLKIFAN